MVGEAALTCCLQWRRAVVSGLYGFTDKVRFANPGALCVRENDADGVAVALQRRDERMHVRRGLV